MRIPILLPLNFEAIDAINPFDYCFTEAAKNGITTVVTGPGSANPIGGQMAAIKTYGKCIDHMILKAPLAIKMALGENPKGCYHGKNQTPSTRMATAAIIREQLQKAVRYLADTEKAQSDPDTDPPDYDAKMRSVASSFEKSDQSAYSCSPSGRHFYRHTVSQGIPV